MIKYAIQWSAVIVSILLAKHVTERAMAQNLEAYTNRFLVASGVYVYTNHPPPNIILLTALSTNWLPMTLQSPNGDGTCSLVQKEVGIIVSNRYAQVVADGRTNKILVSSSAMLPVELLIRDRPQSMMVMTNIMQRGIEWIVPIPQLQTRTNPYIDKIILENL